MAEVVVVGAGVGGLACAARLAAAGHRVTVFERAAEVGGKLVAGSWSGRRATFRFDTGPSLMTLPQVFAELFADLDAESRGWCPSSRRAARVRRRHGARLVRRPGRVRRPDRGPSFGPDAGGGLARLWRRAGAGLGRVVAAHPAPSAWTRRSRWPGWRGGCGDLAAVAPGRTLRGLGRRLRDPRLRMLLDRYATYAGADPRRAPAALVAIPYAELRSAAGTCAAGWARSPTRCWRGASRSG